MPVRRTPLALAFAALTAAGALAPSALAAQSAPAGADSLAFPRKIYGWMRAAQADSLFAHAGEPMKSRMQSPANVTTMLSQLSSQIGTFKSTEGEYQFEKDGKRVYIVLSKYDMAPELAAHVITYAPGSNLFERLGVIPASRAKEQFPEAKLP